MTGVSRGLLTNGYTWTFYRLTKDGNLAKDGKSIFLSANDRRLKKAIEKVGQKLIEMISAEALHIGWGVGDLSLPPCWTLMRAIIWSRMQDSLH
ncbi:unnamed protein product [Vitrella brassicaformis CCMP3155]|uniref:Uncharacterized protein n=1 Tax=Vitrella brassicaformis (strain CCMP3155) TaxID=1169540 RepID=A0A0G4EVY3_VITBC|nr:unnamed protein product [Vitrella brassicaformis CCMP3155]|eukprot:CEM02592.1 unnamed protein product [Vitrella brassicaformis CCMP3155]